MQIELSPHIAQSVLSSNFSLEMRAIQSIFKQGQFADYMRKPQAAFCRLFEELGPHPEFADVLQEWRRDHLYWRPRRLLWRIKELLNREQGIWAATGDYQVGPQFPPLTQPTPALRAKLAALCFCLHFYLLESRGAHQVWVLDLPKAFTNWPTLAFANANLTEISNLLRSDGHRFKDEQREQFAQAVQHASAYCLQAGNVLSRAQAGNPGWAILKSWFADANTSNEMLRAHQTQMVHGLRKMIAMLQSNKIVLLDHPQLRGNIYNQDDMDAKNSEAFVFKKNDPVCAIYVQERFFSENPVIKGPRNYARIIIHEVAHKAAFTIDRYYATNGIRPSVKRLPYNDASRNSDSWAFCILDMADMLVDVEKARALIN